MKKFFVLTFLLFVGGWVAYAQSPQTGNITASGSTCAVTNACVVAQIPANFGSVSVGVSGTYSGTLQFEVNQVQANGTTVTSSVNCYPPNSTSAATSTTGTGLWTCAVVGMQSFDVRSSSYSSGTAAISIGVSNNISVSSLTAGGGGGGGSGTVTSVALTTPAYFTVSGSPVTSAGSISIAGTTGETANEFLATPNGTTGALGLRTLVAADVPTLNQSTTGNAATATALAGTPTLCSTGQAPTGILASGNATGCQSVSGSGVTIETNGVSNTSQTILNLINSAAFNGLTFTLTNTTGGTVQLGATGTLANAGLANSATTVNGQTCTLGATCTVPFQTNTTNNTSQAGINLLTSTANSVGLTVTPTNSATNAEKFEITGASYTGNAATATALASVTGYSVYGSGASAGSWLTPTANGQCLMSGASSYATTTPSFQSCPSSGTSALSGITAATGGNTIASGNNVAQIWNWAMTSASSTAFTFGETTAATSTGTNYILAAKTLAGSTASPLNVVNSLTGSQTLCTVCIFPTWNTSAAADAAIFMNVTNTASGAGSLLADYQVGGTSEWKVDKAGNETVGASVATTSDGVHPSVVSLVGNTTLPTLTANTVNIIGPPSASPTSWSLQLPTAIPTTGHLFDCTVTSTNCLMHDSGVVTANVVNASSPGAGVAHFAGSTQTVTSSLIVAADITNNTITGTQLASSLALTTPNIGAATGTSLLVTGLVDGTAPVIVTTGTTGTPGATYNHSYSFNEEATAATAVTYTLPTAAAGKQYCIANANNGSAANTGALELLTSATGQFIIFTDGTLSATGGYVISGGAAADSACVVGIDATHWFLYVQSGTWTKH